MRFEHSDRYTGIAIAIHWITAVLVFVLVGLGWFMVDLPRGPERGYYFALHKSIGLTVFALLVVRIIWRFRHPPPPFPEDLPWWRTVLAKIVHLAFYAVLIVQPVSGYLSSSFSGYKTQWFGVPLPHWGRHDPPLNELLTEIHVIGSIALVFLVACHLLGVLSHLAAGEGSLLRRMWPW